MSASGAPCLCRLYFLASDCLNGLYSPLVICSLVACPPVQKCPGLRTVRSSSLLFVVLHRLMKHGDAQANNLMGCLASNVC
jgi:hypothetical protein